MKIEAIIAIAIPCIMAIGATVFHIINYFFEKENNVTCKVWAEQWDDITKFNESKNRLIESTSCTADEYARAIKALREPITFIEPTPDQEKLMERILNKPLLSVNEIRESMNMSPLKAEPAWEEVNIPDNGQSYTAFKKIEPKGHLLALKCETCGGELNVIQNSLFDDKTFYVCKYCGNKYIFKGD